MDFKEQSFPDWFQSFDVTNTVLDAKTKYQKIDIFDTKRFGRVLALDNVIQCTEQDEFAYHEMMTHVPLNAYGDPRSVLIVGGGDGGILREVLKHDSVKKVTMVEIDDEIISACRTFLPSICKNAFNDPRTNLIIGDAAEWIKTTTDVFDVIIVDRTDASGPGAVLYETQFYRDCKSRMSKEGIFVAQMGGLFINEDHREDQLWRASQVWRKASFYLTVVPTYAGGFMTILWCADWNITTIQDDDIKNIPNLQYYNTAIHKAAFALPTFCK